MNADSFLNMIAPLSYEYGTGDPRGDLLALLSVVLILGFAVLAFFWIRTSSQGRPRPVPHDRAGEGFDRYASLAGKFEKLEMNSNTARTELMREVELLKSRVDHLEEFIRSGAISNPGDVERGTIESTLPPPVAPSYSKPDYSQTEPVETEPARSPGAPQRPTLDDQLSGTVQSAIPSRDTQEDDDDVDFPHVGPPPSASEDIRPDDARETVDYEAYEFKKKDDSAVRTDPVSSPVSERSDSEGSADKASSSEPSVSLSSGLSKTRSGIFRRIREVFAGKPTLDEETVEDLQAFLVSTDLGLKMVRSLTDQLRENLKRGDSITQENLIERLKDLVAYRLKAISERAASIIPQARNDGPTVVMMVGVNGVGKTTTSAKLAAKWKEEGAKVLLVAADTFRAAASEQLARWGAELGVEVHIGSEGAKPSTVVYDAMERAISERFDVVVLDTAGRLHTKSNLMQELEGIRNVLRKNQLDAPHEVLLVIDGTTGQNALHQAKEFHNSVNLTGLIVTKLDGSSKGGIVVAVQDEYDLPVRYIGVGEAAADLRRFEVKPFVDALFDASEAELNEPSEHGKARRRRRDEQENVAEI